jgi:putative Mn2+ efflux pump MntP
MAKLIIGITFRDDQSLDQTWWGSGIGQKMIKDSITGREEEAQKVDPTKGYTLIMLSVATSIDSLAVGLIFSVLNVSI